jgi:hypothetical protein
VGVRATLARWAAAAPVPTFVVAGFGARDAAQDLWLDPRIVLVAAPRQASVLLLAGDLPEPLLQAAIRAHDVMPAPRAVVAWRTSHRAVTERFPTIAVAEGRQPAETLVAVHRALRTGDQTSTPPILADVDPAPWRGEGPYGQGGSGMTGGVPYGRPMATREDDRDGLTLDALPVPVGPLFAGFPDGLSARITFKGDLVHRFELQPNPFAADPQADRDDPFVRALADPVPVAELEVARARELLRACARTLQLQGLDALAVRAIALASRAGPGEAAAVRRLGRWVTGRWCTAVQLRRVGRIEPAALDGLGVGPVARAAGLAEDVRTDDPAYRHLGFTALTQQGNDAAARLAQRFDEAVQALELAGRADGLRAGGNGVVEGPRGRLTADGSPTARLLELVPELVTGREWGDATAALASLDLDLREAASRSADVAADPL